MIDDVIIVIVGYMYVCLLVCLLLLKRERVKKYRLNAALDTGNHFETGNPQMEKKGNDKLLHTLRCSIKLHLNIKLPIEGRLTHKTQRQIYLSFFFIIIFFL